MEIALISIIIVITLIEIFHIKAMVLVETQLGANAIAHLLESTGHATLCREIGTEGAIMLVFQHQAIAPYALGLAIVGLVLHLATVDIGTRDGDLGAISVLPALTKREVEVAETHGTSERGVEAMTCAPILSQLIVVFVPLLVVVSQQDIAGREFEPVGELIASLGTNAPAVYLLTIVARAQFCPTLYAEARGEFLLDIDLALDTEVVLSV